jgi:hypothetical protein
VAESSKNSDSYLLSSRAQGGAERTVADFVPKTQAAALHQTVLVHLDFKKGLRKVMDLQ